MIVFVFILEKQSLLFSIFLSFAFPKNLDLSGGGQHSNGRPSRVADSYELKSLTLAFNIIRSDAVPLPPHHRGPVSMKMSVAQALCNVLAPSVVQRVDLSQPVEQAHTA